MQNHTGCARATFVFPVVAYGCLVSFSFSEPAMCSLRHPGVACKTMVDASHENMEMHGGNPSKKLTFITRSPHPPSNSSSLSGSIPFSDCFRAKSSWEIRPIYWGPSFWQLTLIHPFD